MEHATACVSRVSNLGDRCAAEHLFALLFVLLLFRLRWKGAQIPAPRESIFT